MEFDFKNFRLSKLNKKEYRYLYYPLYWLLYGFFFFFLESFSRVKYIDVATSLDRKIPFCEYFIIFYVLWYFYMTYVIVYIFFFDINLFKKFSRFAIITYSFAVISYLIVPTMQSLRPEQFVRDNAFVFAVKFLYSIDTPTNVCPSVHVIGSISALITIWNAKGHKKPIIRALFAVLSFLIIISTLFIKQHALLDVGLGILVCIIAYFIVFYKKAYNR